MYIFLWIVITGFRCIFMADWLRPIYFLAYIIRVIIPLDYTTLCSTITIHQQGDHTTRLHYTLLNNHHTSSEWSYHSTTLHSAQQPPYISRVIIPLDYTTLCSKPPYIIRVIIPLDYTTLCSTTTIHHQSDHTTRLHNTLLNNHHTSAVWSYHSTTLHSAQNHHTSSEWSYHSTTLHSAHQPPYISRVIIPLDYTTLCSTTTIHHQSDNTTRLHYTLLNNHHTSSEWSYHLTTLHSA